MGVFGERIPEGHFNEVVFQCDLLDDLPGVVDFKVEIGKDSDIREMIFVEVAQNQCLR